FHDAIKYVLAVPLNRDDFVRAGINDWGGLVPLPRDIQPYQDAPQQRINGSAAGYGDPDRLDGQIARRSETPIIERVACPNDRHAFAQNTVLTLDDRACRGATLTDEARKHSGATDAKACRRGREGDVEVVVL